MGPTTRKHSAFVLARRIATLVRSHPDNADAPTRALARAVGWQVRKRLGRGPVRVRAYGMDLEFPRASGSLSNLFYFGERFAYPTVSFLDDYLAPGDAVIDVGSNVGMFTYAALRTIGPSGRVDAFEPLPWAAGVVEANVARNDLEERVSVHRLAAGDRNGVASYTADLDVSSHLDWVAGPADGRTTIEVRTAPLDEVLDPSRPLALAKIDVEGAEMAALRGFQRHLGAGNPPVVVVEAHDHALRKMGSSRAEVFEYLASHRYAAHTYEPAERRLVPIGPEVGGDAFAVHDAGWERVRERLRREVMPS